MDYIQFLLSECNAETPRNFLIESVLRSMQDLFSTTIYKEDVEMINELAQRFIDYPEEE